METIESFTRQDADLGSAFIVSKEITINFSADDLKNLHHINLSELNPHLEQEQIDTLNELFTTILEGVCDYTLV